MRVVIAPVRMLIWALLWQCDISPGEIDTEKLDKFCQENNFAAWWVGGWGCGFAWMGRHFDRLSLPPPRPPTTAPAPLLAHPGLRRLQRWTRISVGPGRWHGEGLSESCLPSFLCGSVHHPPLLHPSDESINFLVGKILEVVAETDVPLRPREEFIRLDKDAPGASGAGSNNPGAPVKCCE